MRIRALLATLMCLLALAVAGAPAAVAATGVKTASGQVTAIDRAYTQLGGADSGIGKPVGAETCGLRDGGCYRNYEHGGIVWTPDTGAQPSWGAIREAWAASSYEKGPLGYPVAAPACDGGGCAQPFQWGTISWHPAEGATLSLDIDDPDSAAVVVNKTRPLVPAEYAPNDLSGVDGQLLRAEAAEALRGLQQAATAEGVAVLAISGYRPYSHQSELYSGYTSLYGPGLADTISARPGYSEHQTGLAVDIGAPDGRCALQACFEDTAAGAWAAENAHRFGFIIRYPAEASAVTGYAYEPWHLRFVGTQTAGGIHESGATLEEYFGLPSAPDYRSE